MLFRNLCWPPLEWIGKGQTAVRLPLRSCYSNPGEGCKTLSFSDLRSVVKSRFLTCRASCAFLGREEPIVLCFLSYNDSLQSVLSSLAHQPALLWNYGHLLISGSSSFLSIPLSASQSDTENHIPKSLPQLLRFFWPHLPFLSTETSGLWLILILPSFNHHISGKI